ncbi:MAG: phage major capsid protein, partial [Myxococcota bacterium]
MNKIFHMMGENFPLILFVIALVAFAFSPMLRSTAFEAIGRSLEFFAYKVGAAAYFDDPQFGEFKDEVIGGVKALKKGQEEQATKMSTIEEQNTTLLKNYDNLEKDTKQAMEDLTKAKNVANEHATVIGKMQKLITELGNERRMAFGDPLARLRSSEDNILRINTQFRKLLLDPEGKAYENYFARPEVKALTSDTTPGSTYINTALAREIYDLLETYGAYTTLGLRTVGTKTTNYPRKTVRPVAHVVRKLAGGKLVADANKDGASDDISVELIGCLVTAYMELIEDAEVDVTEDILGDMLEALAYRMDFIAFRSDGTNDSLHGGYTGVFPGGTVVSAAAGRTTIGAMKYEDYLAATLGVKAAVLNRRPEWWMHTQQLVRSLAVKDDNGRPIFQTALEAPSFGKIGSVLGYPV